MHGAACSLVVLGALANALSVYPSFLRAVGQLVQLIT